MSYPNGHAYYYGNDDPYSPFTYDVESPYHIPAYYGPPDTHPHYDVGAYETTPYGNGNDSANFGNGRLDGRLVDQGPYVDNEDPSYHAQYDEALARRAADFGVTPQELLDADEHCIREQNEWLATTYEADRGWTILNLIVSSGAFFQTIGTLIFVYNLVWSYFKGPAAGADPWDAWTLEWSVSSPPPEYNFASIPRVSSRRPLWDLKHPEDPDSRYE